MQYKTHMSSSCIFSLSCWRKLDISLRTRARLVCESVSSLFRERFSAWMSSSRFRRLASCRSCSSSNLFSPSCKTQHYTRLLLLLVKLVQSFLQNTALHTSIAAPRQTCSVLPAKHSITHVYCCSSSNLFSPSCKTQHYTRLLLLLVKLVQSFLQNTTLKSFQRNRPILSPSSRRSHQQRSHCQRLSAMIA